MYADDRKVQLKEEFQNPTLIWSFTHYIVSYSKGCHSYLNLSVKIYINNLHWSLFWDCLCQTSTVTHTQVQHLKTLLFGSPFDEQVLVKKTSCLVPDSRISPVQGLHTSRIPHLDNVWTRRHLFNAGLSCKGNKIQFCVGGVTLVLNTESSCQSDSQLHTLLMLYVKMHASVSN